MIRKSCLRERNKRLRCAAAIFLLLVLFAQPVRTEAEVIRPDGKRASPGWAAELAGDMPQVLIVSVREGTSAEVSMHEKDAEGNWYVIVETPGVIGRNGLGKTREGDALTPVGTFHFTCAFGIADDPGCAVPYHKVTDADYWSGDQREGYAYNQMVSIGEYPGLNTSVSEHLISCWPAYKYALNISWNEAGVPGAGSAIFLHCQPPGMTSTAGCIAIPEDAMLTVMQNVQEDCAVVIGEQYTFEEPPES